VTSEPESAQAAQVTAPVAMEWVLPAHWQAVDFISDLHLGEDTPRTFAAWEAHLLGTASDAVVMLGDWLEMWVGDDGRFGGLGRRCVEVLQCASTQRHIAFMAGNRDFLIGPAMLADCGLHGLPDPTVAVGFGTRVLLSHGDALCLADTAYQQFRSLVRAPDWQQQFLALPAAERARIGAQVRHQSEQKKQGDSSPRDWADIDVPAALAWLRMADSPTLVHGHTHRPATELLAPGRTRHVLSDWDLDHAPLRAEVLRWTASGLQRVAPVALPG
jgi:UDP-2,3-diacylglucosamine hydrolase